MISITDIFPLIAMLLCVGAVAGFLAGLLGLGGGIVLVPSLFYIFSLLQPSMAFDSEHLMHMSVGTSLAIIVPTGLSSAFAHYKNNSVDFNLVRNIGFGVVIGVIISTWVVSFLDVHSMKLIFSCAILILAIIMVINPARFNVNLGKVKQPFMSIAGVIIGLVSTLIGIGGATLSVPYMNFHGTSMHRAVGSASALGLVIAVPATIGFIIIGLGENNLPPFSMGYINFMAWAIIVPVSVMVAPLGVRATHNISVRLLKIIFASFMILVAVNMWREVMFG